MNEVDNLSRRVEKVEKKNDSTYLKKKTGKIESKNEIRDSFASNILAPKLKKRPLRKK